jgi:para-nitrobenzyl esterase
MNIFKGNILQSKIVFVMAVLIIFAGCAGIQTSGKTVIDPTVKTAFGQVKGYVDQETLIWKGVPFASAPVGALRWAPPEAPLPWDGVREATTSAKKCTQLQSTIDWNRTGILDPDSSEDCLYVDIYRPEHPSHPGLLPVYVYIHGGSNFMGAASQYDGKVLAKQSDVVAVYVQYRLGPMGWFSHPAVQTGGTDRLADSGNFGTLDNVQALKWIQKNIQSFGGDPQNVTITGESAGAHNVMNLVVSPHGKGLFQRAMSQSGGMATVTTASARNSANGIIEKVIRYKENVGVTEAAARRTAMEKDGTLKAYLNGIDSGTFFMAHLKFPPLPGFPAIEDGTVIPTGGWMPAIKAKEHNIVPIILGSNEYESKPFMPLLFGIVKPLGMPSSPYTWFNLSDVVKGTPKKDGGVFTLNDVLPTQADKDLYEITGYYGSQNWTAKYVDTVAREMAKVQDNVYAYFFKWGGIGSGPSPFDFVYGAGHSGEIPFFFGAEKGLFGYPFVSANEAGRKELQKAMMKYLENFAWTGNPNNPSGTASLMEWKRWSNDQGAPKKIVFNASFDKANIVMMNEELTIEGVMAELNKKISSLPENAQKAAKAFQWNIPWPIARAATSSPSTASSLSIPAKPIRDFKEIEGKWEGKLDSPGWSTPMTLIFKDDGSGDAFVPENSPVFMFSDKGRFPMERKLVDGKIRQKNLISGAMSTTTLHEEGSKRFLNSQTDDGTQKGIYEPALK